MNGLKRERMVHAHVYWASQIPKDQLSNLTFSAQKVDK